MNRFAPSHLPEKSNGASLHIEAVACGRGSSATSARVSRATAAALVIAKARQAWLDHASLARFLLPSERVFPPMRWHLPGVSPPWSLPGASDGLGRLGERKINPRLRKPCPSDFSDEEWAFVAPYLTPKTPDAPQRRYALGEVLNAMRRIGHSGAPWRILPTNVARGKRFICRCVAGSMLASSPR